ncbi:ankyrin repeat domain-containing protein [Wolbachia endosymbiont of Tetranychus urticae]
MEGHEDVVEILLKRGADVNGVESFSGMTSLWLAAQNGHESLVEVLLTAEKSILACILKHYVLLLEMAMKA